MRHTFIGILCIIAMAVTFTSCGSSGDGGGSDACDFTLQKLTFGAETVEAATSAWLCEWNDTGNSVTRVYALNGNGLLIFSDGSMLNFTYTTSGCFVIDESIHLSIGTPITNTWTLTSYDASGTETAVFQQDDPAGTYTCERR